MCGMHSFLLPLSSLHSKTRTLILWFAIGCTLLASVLGAWKAAGLGNGTDPLRMRGITQLIFQDICISHGSQTPPEQPADADYAAPTHKHCSACLIAMDTALPEQGGTWRAQAEALSHARIAADPSEKLSFRLPKPQSHGPPFYA